MANELIWLLTNIILKVENRRTMTVRRHQYLDLIIESVSYGYWKR
jgi:hypothetical protein